MKFVLLLALTVAAVCIHEATGAKFQNHKKNGDDENEQDGLEEKNENPKPHKLDFKPDRPFPKHGNHGKHGKHGPRNPHQKKQQKERKHKESDSGESSESDD